MKSLACELNYIVKGAVYLEHRLNLAVMRHEEYLCGLSRVTFAFLTGKGGGDRDVLYFGFSRGNSHTFSFF